MECSGADGCAAVMAQVLRRASESAHELATLVPLVWGAQLRTADLASAAAECARIVEMHQKTLCALREGLAEQYMPRVAATVVASDALAVHDLAALACASKAWRDAAGPHGVARAALGSEDADERVRGCKAVATAAAAARAAARADAHEAVDAAAAEKKGPFDALLEALLRDHEARVRREAARALWVLSGGKVAPARAKAIAAALDGEALFTLEGHGYGVPVSYTHLTLPTKA